MLVLPASSTFVLKKLQEALEYVSNTFHVSTTACLCIKASSSAFYGHLNALAAQKWSLLSWPRNCRVRKKYWRIICALGSKSCLSHAFSSLSRASCAFGGRSFLQYFSWFAIPPNKMWISLELCSNSEKPITPLMFQTDMKYGPLFWHPHLMLSKAMLWKKCRQESLYLIHGKFVR